MKFPVIFISLILLGTLGATETVQTLHTTAEARASLQTHTASSPRFDLCGTVTLSSLKFLPLTFVLEDSSGGILIDNETPALVKPGDVVHVSGSVELGKKSKRRLAAKKLEIIQHGPQPEPAPTTVANILAGRNDFQLVSVRGTVIDEFQDDIDLNYHHLLLATGKETIIISIPEKGLQGSRRFLNSEISAVGLCRPDMGYYRIFHGHGLGSKLDGITILKPAPDDPFDVPALENFHYIDSRHVLSLTRRRICGTVIAIWHGDRFLISADDGRCVVVTTTHDVSLPHEGQYVCAAGLPDTDLFNINLTGAIWKEQPGKAPSSKPETVTLHELFCGGSPEYRLSPDCHGKSIKVHALVRSIPRADFNNTHLFVEQDGRVLPIDISASPESVDPLEIGCTITLSGICILETENTRLNTPFPRVKGFTIVLRHGENITVISRPSWWTAKRLLAVVGILMAIIVVILLWNIALQRLSERRGRELADSAIAKAESDLKVFERTRLAVELHDSVAQNLTGASLALRGKNYELAAQTLDSCRKDLRNCLWDLRNLTLDDGDINTAIRKTLAPHIGEATLAIRFNVPRERLKDNTTHTILRILRELTTNAVRHGGATAIRIAGSIEGDRLLFSVRDNGCGFDPAAAPGMEQGHFGLQGIHDRIDALEGEISIDSSHGKGTKVTVSLHIPQERRESQQ